MKNTITAILAAALTLTLLTSCGSVDKTADVTVTTTHEAWQPALITAASVTTAERQTSSTFTEKSTTTTKAVTTTKKTTTKKKTTTSKATTTTKAITTAPITTTTVAPRTTTTAAATTTKKATTTTAKVTTTKKPATTTTAAAAKLTQADIDRLVKEAQEYSRQKSKAFIDSVYADCGYSSAKEMTSIMEREMNLSNSSWGTPYTIATAWGITYDEALRAVKGATESYYEVVPDAHIVIYALWCPNGSMNSDGYPSWEIYCLY